jgi:hypothetical protein
MRKMISNSKAGSMCEHTNERAILTLYSLKVPFISGGLNVTARSAPPFNPVGNLAADTVQSK